MIPFLILSLISGLISAESLYKAYVISLPFRENRLRSIENQLKPYGIPYEVFPAISPADIDKERNSFRRGSGATGRFHPETKMNFFSYQSARPTEIACLQSHIQVLFKIAKSDSPAPVLVLEDDAKFEPNFYNRTVELMQEIKGKWDILHVGYCLEPAEMCDRNGERGPNFCKMKKQMLFCTHAYFINGPEAAQTILNYLNVPNPKVIDHMLGYATDNYYVSLPKLAKQFPFQSDNGNPISHWNGK